MASEALNNRTKLMLTQSLRKIMETKRLDRITIADIVKECGVSRRAFYYHFKDVYDATWWMLEEDWKDIIDLKGDDWKNNLRVLLQYFVDNRAFCNAILQSSQSYRMEELFRARVRDGALHRIKTLDEDHKLKERDIELLAQIVTLMLSSVLGGWIRGSLKCSEEELLSVLYEFAEAAVERAVASCTAAS